MAKRSNKRDKKPQYTRKQRKAARKAAMAANEPQAVAARYFKEQMIDAAHLACIKADIQTHIKWYMERMAK